ncbi:hypothetical protein GJAV_G00131420 [Gymnothorax javanicus]|nr:hypothetical protein GJAV_G00131420 [Gymnothorax javanicus]
MSLKPQECTDSQPGPLLKRRPGRVANGLSLGPRKTRLIHQHSDQENNPRLVHTLSKKKKPQKKHRLVHPRLVKAIALERMEGICSNLAQMSDRNSG